MIPLAVVWWQASSGARGLTLHAWNPVAGCLERASAGRAADADPGFSASWANPLLWGASPERLSSGPLDIAGAERRADGTLSDTTRTTVSASPWAELDLDDLAARVNAAGRGADAISFGAPTQRVRIVRPRASFGLGTIELDEVTQQLVWPVTDISGSQHRLVLDATERNSQLLTWLIGRAKVQAIVVVGDQPEACFVVDSGKLTLISLTLTPLPLHQLSPSWRRILLGQGKERRSTLPVREPDDLQRLCASVGDVALAVASSGERVLTSREAQTIGRRRGEASDLGLGTLADALAKIESALITAADLLRLRFVLDRLESLVA